MVSAIFVVILFFQILPIKIQNSGFHEVAFDYRKLSAAMSFFISCWIGRQYLEIFTGNPRWLTPNTPAHAAITAPTTTMCLAHQWLWPRGKASLREAAALPGGWRISELRKAWGCLWEKLHGKGDKLKCGTRREEGQEGKQWSLHFFTWPVAWQHWGCWIFPASIAQNGRTIPSWSHFGWARWPSIRDFSPLRP